MRRWLRKIKWALKRGKRETDSRYDYEYPVDMNIQPEPKLPDIKKGDRIRISDSFLGCKTLLVTSVKKKSEGKIVVCTTEVE